MCNTQFCISSEQTLEESLAAVAGTAIVAGMPLIQTVLVNIGAFTIANHGFEVIYSAPELWAFSPSNKTYKFYQTALGEYATEQTVPEELGAWRFKATFGIRFADGKECTFNASGEMPLLTGAKPSTFIVAFFEDKLFGTGLGGWDNFQMELDGQVLLVGNYGTSEATLLEDDIKAALAPHQANFGDLGSIAVAYSVTKGWTISGVQFLQGVDLKISRNGTSLVPSTPGAGIVGKFMPGQDGYTASDLASIDLLFGSDVQASMPDSSFQFVDELHTRLFQNFAATDYSLEIGSDQILFSSSDLVSDLDTILKDDASNFLTGTHNYLDVGAELVGQDIQAKSLFGPLELTSLDPPSPTNLQAGPAAKETTAFKGSALDFEITLSSLGLQGNEPQVQILYTIAGELKLQTFTYNSATKKYE